MHKSYWKSNIKYLAILLICWFLLSLGCSVLFVDQLDQFSIGGFKLGFWFGQQGAIIGFVAIVFIYVWLMNRLDKRHGVNE